MVYDTGADSFPDFVFGHRLGIQFVGISVTAGPLAVIPELHGFPGMQVQQERVIIPVIGSQLDIVLVSGFDAVIIDHDGILRFLNGTCNHFLRETDQEPSAQLVFAFDHDTAVPLGLFRETLHFAVRIGFPVLRKDILESISQGYVRYLTQVNRGGFRILRRNPPDQIQPFIQRHIIVVRTDQIVHSFRR